MLKGTAKTWYHQLAEKQRRESKNPNQFQVFQDWNKFVEAIRAYFDKKSPKFNALMRILHLKCVDPTQVGEYIEEFGKLTSPSGLLEMEDFTIGTFIKGLPEPFYTIAYNEVNINGTSEYLKVRSIVEQHVATYRAPPPPQVENPAVNNVEIHQRPKKFRKFKSKRRCENCGRTNHDTKECWGNKKTSKEHLKDQRQ